MKEGKSILVHHDTITFVQFPKFEIIGEGWSHDLASFVQQDFK